MPTDRRSARTRRCRSDAGGRYLGHRPAALSVPSAPIYGKTGTAEYGNGVPPRTHAWLVGVAGNLAFAVLVADTKDGFGGDTAGAIAARFLGSLAAG